MLSRQEKPVVHLRPHSDEISTDFGGDMVQIIDAPTKVYLPDPPPTLDKAGNPWSVDAKNLGPHSVQIMGKHGLNAGERGPNGPYPLGWCCLLSREIGVFRTGL